MEPHRGHGGVDDDLPEVPDEQVDGIRQKQALDVVAVVVNGVEDGRGVHQQLGKDAPQVLDIPEEHKQRRKDQPYADVEQHQQAGGIQQQEEPPCERDVVKGAEHEENAQRQAKVDEGLHVLREQEQILGHIDLGEDARVAHQGLHALRGGLVEVGEHQVAAEQIGGIVRHVPPEELGKHQLHHQQHQQR